MSIANLAAVSAAQAASLAAPNAASNASAFAATLQTAEGATPAAYQTGSGRGTPGAGHRHHHHGHTSTVDAANSGQASSGQTNQATGSGQAPTQAPGQLLLSDLMRGLQAYGATKSAG
jgi:hypothetical protein